MIMPATPVDLCLIENRDRQTAIKVIHKMIGCFKFNKVHFIEDPNITNNTVYSRYILEDLYDIVEAPHVLIAQTDGFILNPSAWTDEFLKYDYIGAPWFFAFGCTADGHPPITVKNCVGNGGFSLRSRRLLETTAELSCKHTDEQIYPEDRFICTSIRQQLESVGAQFAPPDLAAKFSVENGMYTGQFGFHGKLTMRYNNIVL